MAERCNHPLTMEEIGDEGTAVCKKNLNHTGKHSPFWSPGKYVEYAVEFKTLIGGPYDRLSTGKTLFRENFTREEAEKEVIWYSQLQSPEDPEPVARLVSRTVTDWRPVNDDQED